MYMSYLEIYNYHLHDYDPRPTENESCESCGEEYHFSELSLVGKVFMCRECLEGVCEVVE